VLNGDAGSRPGMVAAFFGRVARHFANEVAVVTPNGQLLSHDPDEGLKKWRQLPAAERRRLDDLGHYADRLDPTPPEGGLALLVYARALKRDRTGHLAVYKTEVARSLEAGRDRLWLTRAECKALVPAEPRAGQRVPVPVSIADRLCRRALIDLVRVGGNGGPRAPEDVLARHLRVTVEGVSDRRIRLRLDGTARLATHDQGSGAHGREPKVDRFRFLGFLTFDRRTRTFGRFDLVAYSETGHFDEIHNRVLTLGVAFELAAGKTPTDRLVPSSFGKDYFGGDK
jgi:hypothetical protein